MAFPAYLYATPQCVASTNGPNLVSVPTFAARATCTVQCRANIPQLDVQRTSGVCSTNATLRDVPVFRASAIGVCSTSLPRLYGRLAESSPASVLSNKFVGNSHRIITPLTFPMTNGGDTYVQSVSWTGMLGAGHVAEIYDNRGTLLLRLVSGQASDGSFANVPIGRFALNGYSVPTLDSGVLTITVGRPVRN